MSPQAYRQLQAEKLKTRAARATVKRDISFREFIRRVAPRFQFYEHLEKLIDVLQRVADDECDRLLVFMPPRHGKSETVSRLFSAYYLYRHPQRWVGINSYGAELAFTLSRNARDHYRSAGGIVRDDAGAVKHWETPNGGGMWAAGVGGPITGKGFHLGLIDDPVKNAEEAASETVREKHKDWYRSTFSTREEPNGAIVVIQTRWNEDDLSGWLLAQEMVDDGDPERWHIVNMPAIAEDTPIKFPPTCTVERDEREAGEALCVERYPVDKLRRIARRIGSYFWAALYQQRPRPMDGDMFQRDWFTILQACPVTPWRLRFWDKAASQSKAAKFSAGVRMSITEDGRVVIEHVARGKWSTVERRNVMRQTAATDDATFRLVPIVMEQEPGSSGLDSVNDEIRMLRGHAVYADRPSGDKLTRLLPFHAQAEAGNVYLVAGDWNGQYIDELCAVPHGTYMDQVDATSGAFNRLLELIEATPEGTVVHDEAVEISPY